MKKIAIILAVALCAVTLAACSPKPVSTPPSSASTSEVVSPEGTLEEIMVKLYADVKAEMPGTMNTPITEEMSESFTGVTFDRYKEALASDAMINIQAHSVVLMRANSAEEAAALAKDVEEKADPRKWVCAEAEKKIVDVKGDLVVLIMTFEDVADEVHANFKAL